MERMNREKRVRANNIKKAKFGRNKEKQAKVKGQGNYKYVQNTGQYEYVYSTCKLNVNLL